MTECPICNRTKSSEKEFYNYHSIAFQKLKEGWNEWKKAIDLDWKDYLLRLYDVEELGLWIREIIDYLMLEEST